MAISDLIKRNLTKAGYEVTQAFNGMEGADILENRTFNSAYAKSKHYVVSREDLRRNLGK